MKWYIIKENEHFGPFSPEELIPVIDSVSRLRIMTKTVRDDCLTSSMTAGEKKIVTDITMLEHQLFEKFVPFIKKKFADLSNTMQVIEYEEWLTVGFEAFIKTLDRYGMDLISRSERVDRVPFSVYLASTIKNENVNMVAEEIRYNSSHLSGYDENGYREDV